jgi:hypothetical protein
MCTFAPARWCSPEGCLWVQERIVSGQDDRILDPWHVAGVAIHLGTAVDAVLPLVVGGLLHEFVAGDVAFQVQRFGDQRMATGADLAVQDVRPEARREVHEELHDGRVDLVIGIRPVDACRIELQFAAEVAAGQ